MSNIPNPTVQSGGSPCPEPDVTLNATAQEPVKTPEKSHAAQGQNDLFREFVLAWLAVNLIDTAPRRVRRTLKGQEDAVLRAIERFGFRIPILVRSKPGGKRYEVIDGHMRLAVARRLDVGQVPCIVVDDLPDVEIRRLALSLNKLQETGAWDDEALRLEIGEIIEIGGDIEIPGFEMPEIEAIRFGGGAGEAEDPADDVSHLVLGEQASVTQPGYVWVLGEHRVYCGSARDTTALAALCDGQVVDTVFADAPYNLKVNGFVRSTAGGFAEFAEGSGEMPRAEFIAFLTGTLGNTVSQLRPGGILYACIDWRHVTEMSAALEATGLKLINICVWVKSKAGMGGLYRNQHEFVFVAGQPGAKHQNNIQLGKFGRNRSNVWSYAGATGGPADLDDDFSVHPTVKPIRMIMDALLDVTAPGDLVLDPFLGSGTTLLAAERTRRRCIGVEIEPLYVDLVIRRWQAMTGGRAVLARKGQSFDEMLADADRSMSQCVPAEEAGEF